MNAARVVIHAGVHRTGTTSLQRSLSTRRAALAAHGVAYPGEEANHQKLAWALKRGEATGADARAVADKAGDAETVVLSGEDFCVHTDLRWLEALTRDREVRAVFYLRRQDHWLMSWYNQHVKWPFDRQKAQMGPAAFLGCAEEFHWINFAALLGRWSAALGRERVEVGVVERGQVEDVVADFAGRVGVPAESLADDGAPRANDSLPVHVLEFARHLGLFDMPPGRRTRLLAALRAGLARHEQDARTVFTPAQRQALLARYADSNAAVAQTFFGREALFLEPPPSPDDPYFAFPDMPRQKLMREWVAPVVRALLKA